MDQSKIPSASMISINRSTLIFIFFVFGVLLCVIIGLIIKSNTNGNSSALTETTVAATSPTQPVPRVTSELYGVLQDGRNVTRYTLRNDQMQVDILDFGGIVTKIEAPEKNGTIDDLLLGFDSLQEYELQYVPLGAVVGRYANLIAGNCFRLDGIEYCLDVDDDLCINGSNSRGFSKRLWDSRIEDDTLVLTYTSPGGEGGFPGNVNVTVTYHLTEDNELVINYRATTDKPTVINLTNRLFFNLKGHASGNIKDDIVRIVADHYTPLDTDQVPTGEQAPVYRTFYDMRANTLLSMNIDYRPGNHGYDTNFAFGHAGWNKHMASVTHANGRTLDVYSTEPGLQFNTGYHLQGIVGKGGVVYNRYAGLLLEAQHYPNSPNEPRFPTTIVRPGAPYTQTTKYVFGDSCEKSPLGDVNNPITTTVALSTTLNKSVSVLQKGGNTGSFSTDISLFQALELALIVVLIVVIIGLGYLIYKQRNSTTESILRDNPTPLGLDILQELNLHASTTAQSASSSLQGRRAKQQNQTSNPRGGRLSLEQTKELELDLLHEHDRHPEQLRNVQFQACTNEESDC